MDRNICQTIIALQQLKIKDALIDRAVYHGTFSRFDLQTVYDIVVSLNASDSSVKFSLESVERAWQMAQEIITQSEKKGVKIFSRYNDGFPVLLRQIPKPPLLLHVQGNANLLRSKCIAVVGTRAPREVSGTDAYRISQELVRNELTVVSGLAKGIDAAAHEGALDAQGPTIAVLAHGLQMIYPAENQNLAKRIVENNGALISEYAWYTPLMKWFLVDRDRIQSGLSRAVFVIETKAKGGTMHTVEFCKKQNHLLVVLTPSSDSVSDENFSGNLKILNEASANPNIIPYTYGDPVASVLEKIAQSSQGLTRVKTIDDFISQRIPCVRESTAFIVEEWMNESEGLSSHKETKGLTNKKSPAKESSFPLLKIKKPTEKKKEAAVEIHQVQTTFE